ncbi:hypothetical protein LX73_0697 [Fodinibius salinus]|uniref:Uncharacterized protein n=1 Tax=Fodinibius salinus TaxID=860790 RepID=A0A5D3YMQ7_9BACT|nr:hypothetical protein LX73_0697 [Fodinibius salinus]
MYKKIQASFSFAHPIIKYQLGETLNLHPNKNTTHGIP